jgi:acetyl-CoA carboxylase biotin carboxyl carrier protein
MDDKQTVMELLEIMREHDLDAIKVKVGDAIYELVRRDPAAPANSQAGAQTVAPPAAAPAEPANVKKVVAPLTGVFYRSSTPDAEPFVKEGDRVNTGDVLCILEAMKLFNEIQSDYSGSILRIIPENTQLVSQGDELFWIAP